MCCCPAHVVRLVSTNGAEHKHQWCGGLNTLQNITKMEAICCKKMPKTDSIYLISQFIIHSTISQTIGTDAIVCPYFYLFVVFQQATCLLVDSSTRQLPTYFLGIISNTSALPISSIRVTFLATSTVKSGSLEVNSAFNLLRLSY